MIKHIIKKAGLTGLSYPVGENIARNIPIIKLMVKRFKLVKEFKNRPVNIMCQGSSGAIIATFFALAIKNSTIVHVKKPGEVSHSSLTINMSDNPVNLIVDDFISTGETVKRIYSAVTSRVGYKIPIDCLCVCGDPIRARAINFDVNYLITGYQD